MPAFIRLLKNDDINFEVRSTVKNPETGKPYYCTFKPPEGLKTKKAKQKAADAVALEFDRRMREKIAQQSEVKESLKSVTIGYAATDWISINPDFAETHLLGVRRDIALFEKEWGDKTLDTFAEYDARRFIAKLCTTPYIKKFARLKNVATQTLENAVESYGYRRLRKDKASDPDRDFSWATLHSARHGEKIEFGKAEAICKTLKLDINIFDKIEEEHTYAKETIKGVQRTLSSILEHAATCKWIPENYAKKCYLNKGKAITGLSKRDIEVLNDAEFDSLVSVLDKHEIQDTIGVYILLYTGCRRAEMCGLEWRDIDFESEEVNFRRNRLYIPQKGTITKCLKTDNGENQETSERAVPMLELESKLEEYKKYYDMRKNTDPKHFDPNNDNVLFCKYDGTERTPGYVNTLLKRYLQEAGVHNVHVHCLRHTWATKMILGGIPINIVSKHLGHHSVDTTTKIYVHVYKKVDKKYRDAMASVFAPKRKRM